MEFREHVPLAPLTTLGVGGPARFLAEADSEDEIGTALHFARQHSLPLFVLGGGSNLVVSDAGWPGLVLKISIGGIAQREDSHRMLFEAGAGVEWDALVARTVAANCAGMECLSGIPGTVGGTPVQNVGAYGQDVAETIVSVRALEVESREMYDISNHDCGFAYRTSRFNTVDRGKYIVTRVTFALIPGGTPKIEYADLRKHFAGNAEAPSLAQVREALRAIRLSKAMLIVEGDDDARSAGSFFKNPIVDATQYDRIAASAGGVTVPNYPAGPCNVKVPAAWLVEQSGMRKGFTLGKVGISRRHALAIVNHGGATACEVIALKEMIQEKVREHFGVELQPEPVFAGF